MAERGSSAPAEGGFEGGFGDRRGRGRGRGRGDRRGGRRGGRGRREGDDKKEWVPVTKLGRLVKEGKIKSIEEIFLFSLAVKEFEIIDYFFGESLKDEVMKIAPVQKQTQAGQRTRFKAWVIVGDNKGHIGLGCKCASEVANAIRGALIDAKLSIIPVRKGYWGGKFGAPHTVPMKVTGKCGSVRFRLVPAPRGTGIVAAKAPKRLLVAAGFQDVYTSARGKTKTLGNFVRAAYNALASTSSFLTPDQWSATQFKQSPYQVHTDFLRDAAAGKIQGKAFKKQEQQ
jgi:small subunit ribosomal protein S2e